MSSTRVYFISSCDTCIKILKSLPLGVDAMLQDIKTQPITPNQLEEMAKLSGNYESLFSRRALKYKEFGLDKQALGEADYRKYILEHYTFLKRPVVVIDGQIFIGNSKSVVEAAREALNP
jgi:arsenate reductase